MMLRAVVVAMISLGSVGAFTGPGLVMPGSAMRGSNLNSRAGLSLRPPPRPLGLRMAEGGADEEKKARMELARRLAEKAQQALLEAEVAEAKSNNMRGTNRRLDPRSELKARKSLVSVGEVLYKSWSSSFHDMSKFGLSEQSDAVMTEEVRTTRVRKIFESFDTDSSGGIDRAELDLALHGLGYEPTQEMISELFSEADTNDDGQICFQEFYKVMGTLLAKEEIRVLEEQVAAMDVAAAPKVISSKTYSEVFQSLSGIGLIGDGVQGNFTAKILNEYKGDGKLAKWSSYSPTFREYSAEKMKAVTGLQDADSEMGLRPEGLIKQRIQLTQAAGIVGFITLFTAGLFPDPWSTYVGRLGYVGFAINLILPLFSLQLDGAIQNYEFQQQPDNVDRWARRQAGRFFAAYMCGVPVESMDYSDKQRPIVQTYSRQDGNIDFKEMRKGNFSNAFDAVMTYGLTPKQIQAQAVIQSTGLVLEFMKYGKATFGYEFYEELEKQISLSQSFVDPYAKQFLARFGIIASYELIKNHESVVEKVVDGIKEGASYETLVAIIESNEAPSL